MLVWTSTGTDRGAGTVSEFTGDIRYEVSALHHLPIHCMCMAVIPQLRKVLCQSRVLNFEAVLGTKESLKNAPDWAYFYVRDVLSRERIPVLNLR